MLLYLIIIRGNPMKKFALTFACAISLVCATVLSGCFGSSRTVSISGPDTVRVNDVVVFEATANPSGTWLDFTWSIKGTNNIGATISGGTFSASSAGTVTIAVAVDGATDEKTITVLSLDISVPSVVAVGAETTLAATVAPASIADELVWSIKGTNSIGATITNGVFKATSAGMVTISAAVRGVSEDKTIMVRSLAITGPTVAGIGEEVTYTAAINPVASGEPVEWSIQGANTIGATIADGVFRATAEGTVTIRLEVGNLSVEKIVTVKYIEVTLITFAGEREFKVTEGLELSATIVPANATNRSVRFEIVEEGTTAADAEIVDSVLYAGGLGVIRIKAVSLSGGIESDIITITVLKEPVASVQNSNIRNGSYTREQVTENFTGNFAESGWGLHRAQHGDGMITAGANQFVYRAIVLNTDDTVSVDFQIRYAGGNTYMSATARVMISVDEGRNWSTVWQSGNFSIPQGTGWRRQTATIQGSVISGTNRNVWLGFGGGNIGGLGGSYQINSASYTITSRCPQFSAGSSLTLESIVTPNNATFQDITYEIITERTTATGVQLDGNILTATGAGLIWLRPIADGFLGEEFVVRVV